PGPRRHPRAPPGRALPGRPRRSLPLRPSPGSVGSSPRRPRPRQPGPARWHGRCRCWRRSPPSPGPRAGPSANRRQTHCPGRGARLRPMQLLVSVTDAQEATTAARGGADVIDVKDPAAGALGCPALGVVRAVRAAIAPALPVSVALGDGPWKAGDAARAATRAVAEGATFVKLGLRSTSAAEALIVLDEVRMALPPEARLIVAGFADFVRAGSPAPADLSAIAVAAGAHGCLLDTAIKDGRGLFAWMEPQALTS